MPTALKRDSTEGRQGYLSPLILLRIKAVSSGFSSSKKSVWEKSKGRWALQLPNGCWANPLRFNLEKGLP